MKEKLKYYYTDVSSGLTYAACNYDRISRGFLKSIVKSRGVYKID